MQGFGVRAHRDRPETMRQAQLNDARSRAYGKAGLCLQCRSQAAQVHALGAHRVHPPCAACLPVLASFPVGPLAKGWRLLPSGRGLSNDSAPFSATAEGVVTVGARSVSQKATQQ